jgi:hypothetical protein
MGKEGGMRRASIIGVCLATAFALSATATVASAFEREPPEYGRCVKQAGGKWKDGGCKTPSAPGEEKFEWIPAFETEDAYNIAHPPKLRFKLTAKEVAKEFETALRLETVKEENFACNGTNGKGKEAITADGEITGPKTSRLSNIVIHGCEFWEVGECGPFNEVNELDGLLGVQKFGETSAKNKIANLLAPSSGEIIVEPDCHAAVVIKGSVLNPVTVNAMRLTPTVKWNRHKSKQKPERFATDPEGTKRVLLWSKLGKEGVQAGLSLTAIQTNEEKLEISTVN